MLLIGHDIRHHLAGMREPRQAVDDRHGRILRELHQRVMIEDADHDDVDEARQHACGVGDGLAATELHFGAGEHHDFAAELAHADLERHAGARRGLFEDHRQRLVLERTIGLGIRAIPPLQLRLHGGSRVHDIAQLTGRHGREIKEVPQ
jgi:hypothetical protein